MSEVHVKGLRELNAFLQTLPLKVERSIMRGSLRAGANVIKEEVKQNAPVHDGDLKRSVRVSTRSKGGTVTATVKIGNKKAWYAHLIELTGAAAHIIRAKKGSALNVAGSPYRLVNHPGMKAKPFVRPAFDARAQDAVVAAGNYIKERLATKHGMDTSDISIEAEK